MSLFLRRLGAPLLTAVSRRSVGMVTMIPSTTTTTATAAQQLTVSTLTSSPSVVVMLRGFSTASVNYDHGYEREVDDQPSLDAAAADDIDLDEINRLIFERNEARSEMRFEEADAIRDELMRGHGVRLFDNERAWRSGQTPTPRGMRLTTHNRRGGGGGGGDRREPRDGESGGKRNFDFGPRGHDYVLSADAGPNASPYDEDEIHVHIAERLQAKLVHDFAKADKIQAQLMDAGVFMQDRRKEWRADGQAYANDYAKPRNGYGGGSRGNGGGYGGGGGSRDRTSNRSQGRGAYVQAARSPPTEFVKEIQALVEERSEAKRTRNFEHADDIRDDLKSIYNVHVDDKLRQWQVGGPRAWGKNREGGGGGDRREPSDRW